MTSRGRVEDGESPFLLEALKPLETETASVATLVPELAAIARRLSRVARRHVERALVRQLADTGVRDRQALTAAVSSLRRALADGRTGEAEALDAVEEELSATDCRCGRPAEREADEEIEDVGEAEDTDEIDEADAAHEASEEDEAAGDYEAAGEDEAAGDYEAAGDDEAREEDESGEDEEDAEASIFDITKNALLDITNNAPPIDVAKIKRFAVGELEDAEAAPALPDQEEEASEPTPATLPFLLAGPIVRRADPSVVWFWFACKEEVTRCTPRLTVYEKDGTVVDRLTDANGQFRLREPEWRVTRLGERLWVVLVAARPKGDAFPVDWRYGYDLEIEYKTASGTAMKKLSSLGLAITYQPFKLPTFVLARSEKRLAQGSCRRPGGHGADAFAMFDQWLATKITDVSKRPSALFLTGDQIYADDVALPLFRAVQKLARNVFGYVEQLPRDGKGLVSADHYKYWARPAGPSWATAGIPIPKDTRKALTSRGTSPIGFTTEDGEGHLLSFAEYAAMYLLVWNPDLRHDYKVDDGTNKTLEGFQDAVGAARRVLANTATYMLFDDHDITDDWNLDADWEKGTRNSMAQRIMANGLAAYWAFQGWGNDPEAYTSLFRDVVARHLAGLRQSKGQPGLGAPDFDKVLLSRQWSFVAPTAHPALCVDIRTRRETPRGKTAVLSGPRVWPTLRKLAEAHQLRKGDPLLIVLPTPLLPHRSLMRAQDLEYDWPRDRFEGDYEFYGNNPRQRAELILFLRHLLEPSALMVFSGDVHHGSVIDGLYVHGKSKEAVYKGKGDWAMRIAQVTSSPIKNIKSDVYEKNKAVVTDYGNAGESLIRQFENQYATTTENTVIALRADARKLKGPLGRQTFIFENHFCVVDIPDTNVGTLDVLFLGMKDVISGLKFGVLATATMSMSLENKPSSFKPPALIDTMYEGESDDPAEQTAEEESGLLAAEETAELLAAEDGAV